MVDAQCCVLTIAKPGKINPCHVFKRHFPIGSPQCNTAAVLGHNNLVRFQNPDAFRCKLQPHQLSKNEYAQNVSKLCSQPSINSNEQPFYKSYNKFHNFTFPTPHSSSMISRPLKSGLQVFKCFEDSKQIHMIHKLQAPF